MTTVNAHVTHGDKTTYFECWSLSHAWGKLKSVTFFATMPHVKQVLAAFDDNGMFYIPGHRTITLDECGYKVLASKVMGKHAMVHVRSLDKRVLWTREYAELYAALMASPFETPLLPRWMPAFRAALEYRKLVLPITGHNPIGEVLGIELTPKKLDELASKGLKDRKLNLR